MVNERIADIKRIIFFMLRIFWVKE